MGQHLYRGGPKATPRGPTGISDGSGQHVTRLIERNNSHRWATRGGSVLGWIDRFGTRADRLQS